MVPGPNCGWDCGFSEGEVVARQLAVVCVLLLCATAGRARGAEAAKETSAPAGEALTASRGRDLLLALRGATRLGVQFLKSKQGQDGDWFAPGREATRIPAGYRTVKTNVPVYKTVKVTVPVYKTKTETVMQTVADRKVVGYKEEWGFDKDPNDPYAPARARLVKRPIYETVGTHQEKVTRTVKVLDGNKTEVIERQVPDGNKTRVVERQEPVYQESEPIMIFTRWTEGQNALALYALLVSGEPADSEVVTRGARWLFNGTMGEYGLPDTTAELSLFIMAFCRLDRQSYGAFVEQMLQKIVRGQINDGEARGLWDTYSVDFDRLKGFQASEKKAVQLGALAAQSLNSARQALAAAKGTRNEIPCKARVIQCERTQAQVDAALRGLHEKMAAVSRDFCHREEGLAPRQIGRPGGEVRRYPRALYDAGSERHANVTDTHLALLALRDGARHGYLKEDSSLGREAFAALARTANALKKVQRADGTWGYAPYERQRAADRDGDKAQGKAPAKPPVKPPEDPGQPSMSMTAAGLACMEAIAEIVGPAKLRERFGDTISRAQEATRKHLAACSEPGAQPPIPVDNQFSPSYYYFALGTALDDPSLGRTQFSAIPAGVFSRLLFAQEKGGSWPAAPPRSFGWSAYMRDALDADESGASRIDGKLVNTCFALILLAEAGSPEIGAQWHWSGKTDAAADSDLAECCDALEADCRIPLRWRSVVGRLPDGLAAFVPALVIRGKADPDGLLAAAGTQVDDYLKNGGMLIVQLPEGADAVAFETRVKELVRAACKGVEFKPLPAEHPAFGYSVKVEKALLVEGAWEGERLVALFLREGTAGGEGLSKKDVEDVTRNVLGAVSHTKELEPSVLTGPKDWATVREDVDAAVGRLAQPEGQEAGAKPAAAPEAAKPTEQPKAPDAAKLAEQPKAPEAAKQLPTTAPAKADEPQEKSLDDQIKELNELLPDVAPKDRPSAEDEKF